MIGVRRSSRLFLTLAAELAVVWSLTTVGARPELALPRHHLGSWLQTRPPADVLVALLRGIALVGAWWLLAGTVLYAVAAASRIPGALRAVRWATLPSVRRVVDAAFAASLVAGVVFAPTVATAATATDPPPTTTVVRDGRGGELASLPASEPTTTTAAAPVTPTAATASVPIVATDVVVAPGDSLWELAAEHLARATGRPRAVVADVEIAPYWARLCDRNRDSLRSGDPNLVFPGERVTMPPLN
jgi:resuscitation-promoting factor RpfA